MEIRPIKTETDYELALARLDALMDADPGSAEGDELDLLATLIEAYEFKHHPIDAPDPIEAILFRMEQQGLTRKDLEGALGSRSRVSEVLRRKRPLNLRMIRNLHEQFGIPYENLMRDPS